VANADPGGVGEAAGLWVVGEVGVVAELGNARQRRWTHAGRVVSGCPRDARSLERIFPPLPLLLPRRRLMMMLVTVLLVFVLATI